MSGFYSYHRAYLFRNFWNPALTIAINSCSKRKEEETSLWSNSRDITIALNPWVVTLRQHHLQENWMNGRTYSLSTLFSEKVSWTIVNVFTSLKIEFSVYSCFDESLNVINFSYKLNTIPDSCFRGIGRAAVLSFIAFHPPVKLWISLLLSSSFWFCTKHHALGSE